MVVLSSGITLTGCVSCNKLTIPMEKRNNIKLIDNLPDEALEWMLMTEEERLRENQRMWQTYLALGGSLDPEPDPQSPFYILYAAGEEPADRRPGSHRLRSD